MTLEEYLQEPCRKLSIPLWKAQTISIPVNMKIIHDNDFQPQDFFNYLDERYFRLYHDLNNLNAVKLDKYYIVTATYDDIPTIANVINASYVDIKVTSSQIEEYTRTKVYDPALWILVKDVGGIVVGCGIADYDPEAKEVILEWVQVLPEYRRKGIGQFIVNELLTRKKHIALFATVSGKIDNPTNPEALYRKCGFTGGDIWHILTLLS